MEQVGWFLMAVGLSGLIYFIGNLLIDAFFRRKEKFVENLQNRMKDNKYGSCE